MQIPRLRRAPSLRDGSKGARVSAPFVPQDRRDDMLIGWATGGLKREQGQGGSRGMRRERCTRLRAICTHPFRGGLTSGRAYGAFLAWQNWRRRGI